MSATPSQIEAAAQVVAMLLGQRVRLPDGREGTAQSVGTYLRDGHVDVLVTVVLNDWAFRTVPAAEVEIL